MAYNFSVLRGSWRLLREKFEEVFDLSTGHDHDGANSKAVSVGTVGDGLVTNAKLATDVKMGSLAALTTSTKASAVAAVNEVDSHADTNATSIGTLGSLTTDIKTNLVVAINEVDAHADASLVGDLASLTTSAKNTIVAAVNEVDANADEAKATADQVGTLATLTTTTKANAVAAINEVDAHADTAQSKANEVGTLGNLTTTEKGSAVGAINEVDGHADTANGAIGTLASLTTTEQGTLVGAINEVDGHADSANTGIGTLGNLTTDAKTSAVVAINEVDGHADAAQSKANEVGTLSSLTTTAQTSAVAAINEVDGHADTAQSTAEAKYTKPGGGIPESDLTSAVQVKLNASGDAVYAAAAGNVVLMKTIALNGVNPTQVVFSAADYAAYITGSAATPFALDNGLTLIVNPDGAGDDTVTFAAAAGTSAGAAGPSTDMTAEPDTKFKISVNGGAAQTVTCDWAGCNTGNLVAAQMQTKVQALGGVYAATLVVYDTDHYLFTSSTKGTASSVVITPGATLNCTEELKIGVADGGTETGGTGDAANIAAATAAEVAAALLARATGWSGVVDGTHVKIVSDTTGAASTLAVNAASTADAILGIAGSARGAFGFGYGKAMGSTAYYVSATLNNVAQASLAAKGLSNSTRTTAGFYVECETAACTDNVDLIVIGVPAV